MLPPQHFCTKSFLAIWKIYVKSIRNCKISKTAVSRALNFHFSEFVQLLRAVSHQKLKFKASKNAKMVDFQLLHSTKLIGFHVKSEWQKISLISTLWAANSVSREHCQEMSRLSNTIQLTVWKFQDFYVIKILCETNFEGSRSCKSANFAILQRGPG